MTELSNWGRWGKDDQLGTFNLITPAKRKAALKLARDGVAVSLAHTLDKEQFPDNPRPLGQQMMLDNAGHAMDLYSIWYHGSTITHIDALCHYSFEGKIFNGFERSKIAQGPGCPDNGVEHQKTGIMTRGIIVDLPRMKNVPYLEPGHAGVSVGSRSVGEIRRHQDRQRRRGVPPHRTLGAARSRRGRGTSARNAAGFHASVMPWLKQRDVALLGNDAVNDVQPSGVEGNGAADSSARDRRDGPAAGRRDGSGGRGRTGRAPATLGIPADRRAGAGAGRNGVPTESDRDVSSTGAPAAMRVRATVIQPE